MLIHRSFLQTLGGRLRALSIARTGALFVNPGRL